MNFVHEIIYQMTLYLSSNYTTKNDSVYAVISLSTINSGNKCIFLSNTILQFFSLIQISLLMAYPHELVCIQTSWNLCHRSFPIFFTSPNPLLLSLNDFKSAVLANNANTNLCLLVQSLNVLMLLIRFIFFWTQQYFMASKKILWQ